MIIKPKNWEEVEESEVVSNDGLEVGAYICQIKSVKDIAEKEYLEIQFDIVQGKYANYFSELKERLGLETWSNQGIYRASYKETATKFFKAFITAVQKSNQGYVWNWEPTSLLGKYMVANFGQEEYEDKNTGDIKVSTKAREIRSIEAYKKGEVKTLPLKKLKTQQEEKANPFADYIKKEISDADIPF